MRMTLATPISKIVLKILKKKGVRGQYYFTKIICMPPFKKGVKKILQTSSLLAV